MKDRSVSGNTEYERTFGRRLGEFKDGQEWDSLDVVVKSYVSYMLIERLPTVKRTSFTVISAGQGALESIIALIRSLYEDVEAEAVSFSRFATPSDHAIQFAELVNSATHEHVSRRYVKLTSMEELNRENKSPQWKLLRVSIVPTQNHLQIELPLVGIQFVDKHAEFWLDVTVLSQYEERDRISKLFDLAKMVYGNPVVGPQNGHYDEKEPMLIESHGLATKGARAKSTATHATNRAGGSKVRS
jgi:hypothetical protein